MYRHRTSCRACGLGETNGTLKVSTAAGDAYAKDNALIPVFDLGVQPLANDFVKQGEECAGYAPLKVLFCPRCKLGQLSVEVDPVILYANNYAYVTSPSQTMKEHFRRIDEDLSRLVKRRNTVVEIGSNDGLLLENLLTWGWKTALGIDPAQNLSKVAQAKGLSILPCFFNEEVSKVAYKAVGHPDLILARHCFCHINDWKGFVRALENLAGENTVIAIEVPWAQNMLDNLEFDTIYHEHTSYLSISSVQYLLDGTSLYLYAANPYAIHGGALMLIIKRRGKSVPFMPCSEDISLEKWRIFAQKSEVKIMELGAQVRNLVSRGKKVVGYGASAKSTVWVNACNFTKKEIAFICDNTKGKWYATSPGTDIPIVDDGALTRELPDAAVMFSWNYEREIKSKEKFFSDKGGQWLVPI